ETLIKIKRGHAEGLAGFTDSCAANDEESSMVSNEPDVEYTEVVHPRPLDPARVPPKEGTDTVYSELQNSPHGATDHHEYVTQRCQAEGARETAVKVSRQEQRHLGWGPAYFLIAPSDQQSHMTSSPISASTVPQHALITNCVSLHDDVCCPLSAVPSVLSPQCCPL
ncbi:hypothetical protein KUCAC02_023583, partial [Chaenocephalus aceratus]